MKKININEIKESKTQIIADDLLKVYYMTFKKEERLPEHSLNGIGLLQVLEGSVTISFDTGENFDLVKGDLLEFKSSILHTLLANEDSKILVINASYSN